MDPRFFQPLSPAPQQGQPQQQAQPQQGGGGTPQMDDGSFQPLSQSPQMDEGSFQPLPGQSHTPPGNPTATMSAHNSHSLLNGHWSDDAYHKPGESTGEWIAKEGEGLLAGAGRAAFGTISGVVDAAHKHLGVPVSDTVTDTLHDLSEQHDNTTSDMLGYGGETLLEFLGGDAALKALSVPERLSQMANTWKLIQSSPRLMTALKFGAAALKGGTELSPEEAQLVAKYPKLKAMLHLGAEAARAATVQGGQTLARSGGDVGEAAKDAALTAATVGVAHGATAGAAKLLGKGREAAQTIEEMTARGANAPSATEVNDQFGNTVQDAFGKERGTLQNQLDDATSTIQMAGQGAPSQQSITDFAQKRVAAKRKALSDEYVNGLKQLSELIDSDPENPTTIPYEGSPLHQAAQELANEGAANEGPLDDALSKTRPGSPRANRMIDSLVNLNDAGEEEESKGAHNILAEFVKNGGGDAAALGGEAGEEGAELNLKHLTEARRVLGERLRNLGFTSSDDLADRQIYKRLIRGVDDTIAHLADASDGVAGDLAGEGEAGEGAAAPEEGEFTPEEGDDDAPLTTPGGSGSKARALLDQINTRYRNGIRLFQNSDVKALLKGNQNDVVKKLISGGTSLDDINAVRKVIGDQALKTLGDSSIQNMIKGAVDDFGDLDHKKLFKQWQRINPDVRKAMFGNTGDALSKALGAANNSSEAITQIDKQIQSLLGNGDMESLLKSPDKVREIAKVVGPDGMKTLGQSMLEQKIGEATTRLDPKTGQIVADRFDPDKVLDWWNSFKDNPEVRDMLFHPDAKSKEAYTELMKRLGTASSVKKLVKYGLLPATVGTAGVVHGPLAALVAATAGLGEVGAAHFGSSRSILDHIANNPRTWRLLAGVGKAAEAAHSSPVANVAKKSAYNIYKGAEQALGGSDDEQPEPEPDQGAATPDPQQAQ